ncbi:hypothetical protein [Pseudomonas qingdaonensis]|nr:hypothetical protein [Pseudomonas qingdaonensis]
MHQPANPGARGRFSSTSMWSCFRSEAEARAFVDTLQQRLRAPHPLKQVG